MSRARDYRQEGAGPTLILVPGLDGTALLFYRQIPSLAGRFHVVTFPLPDDPRGTMESLVSELHGLVAHVLASRSEDRVLLCGESFGGALSLSYALAHPERVGGLVILNSFSRVRQRFRLLLGARLLRLLPWGAMPLVRRFTESRLHTSHTLPEDLREFHQRSRAITKRGYVRRLEILRDYDIRDRLAEITAPTLLLAADRDQLVPSVEEARFMSSRLPRATVRVLEGYGHICMISHDFDLLSYVAPWLDGTEPRCELGASLA